MTRRRVCRPLVLETVKISCTFIYQQSNAGAACSKYWILWKQEEFVFFVLLRHPQSHPHYRWLFTENIHYFITLREYDFFVGMAGGWQEKLDGECALVMRIKATTAGRLYIWFQQWKNIIQEKQDTYQCYCPFRLLQKFAPNLEKIYKKLVKINAKNCYCHFICHV